MSAISSLQASTSRNNVETYRPPQPSIWESDEFWERAVRIGAVAGMASGLAVGGAYWALGLGTAAVAAPAVAIPVAAAGTAVSGIAQATTTFATIARTTGGQHLTGAALVAAKKASGILTQIICMGVATGVAAFNPVLASGWWPLWMQGCDVLGYIDSLP